MSSRRKIGTRTRIVFVLLMEDGFFFLNKGKWNSGTTVYVLGIRIGVLERLNFGFVICKNDMWIGV